MNDNYKIKAEDYDKYKDSGWIGMWDCHFMAFCENHLRGHKNIGPVTLYGENAMHWAINIRTKRFGYICFRLPFRCFGSWWPLYFYVSPNATPWASTFYRGPDKYQKKGAAIRRKKFGINYDANLLDE